jgi:type IV pilus assembly protein PilE
MRTIFSKGFTLIELMIVVVVMGILAAIAYPSYTRFIVESRRTDAQVALTQMAALQEKLFSSCNKYTVAIDSGAINPGCNGLGLTSSGTAGSIFSPDKYYLVTVAAGPSGNIATSFTATATPVTGKSQASDGKFTISSTGAKQWDKNNDGTYDSSENTWKKH